LAQYNIVVSLLDPLKREAWAPETEIDNPRV
jgi:hypothetical protein